MPLPKLYNQDDLAALKGLYFAYYTPKEASDYMYEVYKRPIQPNTISRIYSAFKLSQEPRFDRTTIIPPISDNTKINDISTTP